MEIFRRKADAGDFSPEETLSFMSVAAAGRLRAEMAVAFAATGFSEGVGPLTPHTYWWHQGSFEQLTAMDDQGVLSVHVGPGFQAVLEALVG